MTFPRRQRAASLVNAVELAPLIDVVLLLLIFFMVSTTFMRREALTVTLPSASAGRAAPAEAVEVQVSADGRYLVDGQALSLAALQRTLAQRAEPGRPLRLAADRDARHHAVVRALDAAAAVGIADVRLATRRARVPADAD